MKANYACLDGQDATPNAIPPNARNWLRNRIVDLHLELSSMSGIGELSVRLWNDLQ